MPDLELSVHISRDALGLAALELNDHVDYYCAPEFLGAQVSWRRTQVSSPFNDGLTTTHRAREVVQEPVSIEVLADSPAAAAVARQVLIEAMSQSQFTMTVSVAGQVFSYQCEAADYQPVATGSRWIAGRLQVAFTVPRQPVPILGGV